MPDIPAEGFVGPEFLDVSREEFGQMTVRPRDLRQAEIQIVIASSAAPKPLFLLGLWSVPVELAGAAWRKPWSMVRPNQPRRRFRPAGEQMRDPRIDMIPYQALAAAFVEASLGIRVELAEIVRRRCISNDFHEPMPVRFVAHMLGNALGRLDGAGHRTSNMISVGLGIAIAARR